MKIIWYTADDRGPYRFEVSENTCMTRPYEQIDIAQQCASDYHYHHDGWDSSWPIDIALYKTEDGDPIATLEVEREAVPEFTATHKRPPLEAGDKAP